MAEKIKTNVQFKRLLLVLLALVMLVTVTAFAACAVEVVDSGTCGDNLTWSLDSNGVLTISGTGEMRSWNDYNETTPWYSQNYTIKSVIIGNGVTTIGARAFSKCVALTSITIPNSVTTIGARAFSYCYALTSITIPDSVTTIGDYAFHYCYELTSITIPDRVTSIGRGTFSECDALTGITIPDSVTAIGAYAFSYCDALTSITIPNRVNAIGDYAFFYCEALTSITILNGVTTIGDYAFEYCDALTNITIPDSVTAIGNYAFSDCDSLEGITVSSGNNNYSSDTYGVLYNKGKTELIRYPSGSTATIFEIPNSVTAIGYGAFSGCYSLTSITIPNSVTTIGGCAFSGCNSLKSITIPHSVTAIGYSVFSKCYELTSITIPNSVTAIGDSAFYYCYALTSITIPRSVTAIGDYAFSDCNALKSITISDSVTAIGDSAFSGCNGIKDVYYQGNSSGWSNISFADAYSNPCCYGASIYFYGESIVAVTGLKVAMYSTTYLKLTWTNISGVTGYRVFKYNPTTKKYESYKNTTSNSLTVTGLKAGTQYYFKVRAYKSLSGKTYWGDYSSFLKTATIPPTVTGLKVASYGNTALKLTWTNISGVTGYKVYKYNPTTKKYESYKNSTSNSLTVTGLKAGTQYYFKVRAYKSISGRNYWGNYSSFLKTATRPLNAKISSVSSPSSGRLTAKWGKVSGATGYYVQYSTNSRFSGAKAKCVNTNYINLTGLTGGTTYYIRVRPYVQMGSSKIYSPNLSAYKYIKIR